MAGNISSPASAQPARFTTAPDGYPLDTSTQATAPHRTESPNGQTSSEGDRTTATAVAIEDPIPHRSDAATPASAKARRSVTIHDDRGPTRRARGTASEGAMNDSSSHHHRRSASRTRQSFSLPGRKSGEAKQIDVLREPRRSIGKRPDEFDLRARDPHKGGAWYKPSGAAREVPFAAPYPRTGIVVKEPSRWSDWLIPGPLTFGHGQWWYLVLGQSILAAVISGAINFGVGVATYNHYQSDTPIYLWRWYPVPLAGDMGVTVIIQQIVSMLITSALVHHDLTHGPIGPLRRPWPPLLHLPSTPSPKGSWLGVTLKSEVQRAEKEASHQGQTLYMGKAEGKSVLSGYFWWFVRSFLTGSERNDLFAKGISWRQRLERILWTAVQGFVLCLLTFWWFWPISIAIVAPIYGGRNLQGTFIPAIVKLLFGAIMSLLTNPIMALLAMGAESSVRRAYPEIALWQDFGGREDYASWLVEQRLTSDEVEIGPSGISRRSVQLRRPSEATDVEAQYDASPRQVERRNGSPQAGDAAQAIPPPAGVVAAPALPVPTSDSVGPTVEGGRPISRHITEEPTGQTY